MLRIFRPPFLGLWILGLMCAVPVALVAVVVHGVVTLDARISAQPIDQTIPALVACERFVAARLKAPGTARFATDGGGVPTYKAVARQRDSSYVVHEWVDAQNSFGALLRVTYNCRVRALGGDQWKVVRLSLAGE